MSSDNPPHIGLPAPSPDTLFLLGQIHATVQALKEGQDVQNDALLRMGQSLSNLDTRLNGRMDKMDERLRTVEQRSAAYGAVSGGAVALGIALLVESLKGWVKRGTP